MRKSCWVEAVDPSIEATEEAEEAEERAAEAWEALLAEEEEGMAEGQGRRGISSRIRSRRGFTCELAPLVGYMFQCVCL